MRAVNRMVAILIAVGVAGVVLTACASTPNQETPATRDPSATSAPSSSPPPQPSPISQTLLLTGQGLAGVPVGATLKDFAEALGGFPTPMTATDSSVFTEHSCVIRQLARLRGVGFMVIGDDPDGRVRRISIVAGSDLRTDTGIGLGSSLDAVRAAHGPGLDEPFDHFPVGGDAVLVPAGADLYLVFIGDDKNRVAELRLGYRPEVLYPEGCV